MKLEKNKIVFASLLLCVIVFIGVYTLLVLDEEEMPVIENKQIPVPKLKDDQKIFDSKLDAINDLKEVKQTNAPSIYDERLLDTTGVYDPDLLDKEKLRIVDSIYSQGRIHYSETLYQNENLNVSEENVLKEEKIIPKEMLLPTSKEISLDHQLFFASNPKKGISLMPSDTDLSFPVIVDGTQTVKANYRVRLRLMKDVVINNMEIPRNTFIFGFVSFQPNRALIDIENINGHPLKLKAFDFQDGQEGIYVENTFRADATRELVGDVVQDINISGVPQVSGIKKLFRRNNNNTRVTILNDYQLILKLIP